MSNSLYSHQLRKNSSFFYFVHEEKLIQNFYIRDDSSSWLSSSILTGVGVWMFESTFLKVFHDSLSFFLFIWLKDVWAFLFLSGMSGEGPRPKSYQGFLVKWDCYQSCLLNTYLSECSWVQTVIFLSTVLWFDKVGSFFLMFVIWDCTTRLLFGDLRCSWTFFCSIYRSWHSFRH